MESQDMQEIVRRIERNIESFSRQLERLKSQLYILSEYGIKPHEIKTVRLIPVDSKPRYFRIKGVIQRDADGAPEELSPTIIYHSRVTMRDGTTKVVEDDLVELLGLGRAS
jgi:hypothetical protein